MLRLWRTRSVDLRGRYCTFGVTMPMWEGVAGGMVPNSEEQCHSCWKPACSQIQVLATTDQKHGHHLCWLVLSTAEKCLLAPPCCQLCIVDTFSAGVYHLGTS